MSFDDWKKSLAITKISTDKGDLYSAVEKGTEPGKGWAAHATTESGLAWEVARGHQSRLLTLARSAS